MNTPDHLARLERKHERMWICLTLPGEPVLLLHEPETVCYSIIAFYRNQEWFECEGLPVSRARVLKTVKGCAGSACR